jgi:hypothetical protein
VAVAGEHVLSTGENHEQEPRRRNPRFDSNSNPLIQGLERLRDCVEQRLVRLEALARERVDGAAALPAPVGEPAALEQRLQQQIAEYQEAQSRLRALAERREQEWKTALEQLEGDRKLLAEAWERLERERIDGIAAAPAQSAGRSPQVERGHASPSRVRPDLAEGGNDLVAHAILRQFQTLRNDVRRNARQRGPR